MARRVYNRIRTGVAGWSYDDWHGAVYPDPKPPGFDPLPYLARYLDLIEINSTFYRPPRPEYAERWANRVGQHPGFRFTAKLWRRFTHERGEAWSRDEVRAVRTGLKPLREHDRLDALLIQFPWSFKRNDASLEWLADLRAAFRDFPLVIEVRHASWNEPGFFEWLAAEGVGFVNIDQPLFSRSIPPSARGTARTGYVRVHGRNYQDWFRKGAGRDARYNYLYSREELEGWVERAREVARDDQVDTVEVVFNNHYRAQAVINALAFRSLLGDPHVVAPATLAETFPDEIQQYHIPVDH
ncbi:MAG: DUF72 domain-containing protein [Gemmatimonadota bacterium]